MNLKILFPNQAWSWWFSWVVLTPHLILLSHVLYKNPTIISDFHWLAQCHEKLTPMWNRLVIGVLLRTTNCTQSCLWDVFPILHHLYNFKNVKNTHGGLLLFLPATLLKATHLHWYFSRFLISTNGTKSRKAPHTKVS